MHDQRTSSTLYQNAFTHRPNRYPGHLQAGVSHRCARRGQVLRRHLLRLPQSGEEDHRTSSTSSSPFTTSPEHWVHLRTSNPIESTFSTVRLRTKVTRGAGSRKAGSGYGLQAVGRRTSSLATSITAPELVPLVRAGATFIDGKLQERRPAETEPKSPRQRVRRSLNAILHPQLLTMTLAFPPSAGHADVGLMVDAERLAIRPVVDIGRLIPEALRRSEGVVFTLPLLSMP